MISTPELQMRDDEYVKSNLCKKQLVIIWYKSSRKTYMSLGVSSALNDWQIFFVHVWNLMIQNINYYFHDLSSIFNTARIHDTSNEAGKSSESYVGMDGTVSKNILLNQCLSLCKGLFFFGDNDKLWCQRYQHVMTRKVFYYMVASEQELNALCNCKCMYDNWVGIMN